VRPRHPPALILLAAFTLASACYSIPTPVENGLAAFQVDVTAVTGPGPIPGSTGLLAVVTPCAVKHGGDDKVPLEVRGTKDCPYQIPRGEVELQIVAKAFDLSGQPMPQFEGPVSFRVIPGDLTGDYPFRWAKAVKGVAVGTVKVAHLYGEVRAWAEDAPPQLIYVDGGVGGTPEQLPTEPAKRTLATGLSKILYFDDPTIAKLQVPDGADNRSSPLVGQFITVGYTPESGKQLIQSCSDDPVNDGQVAKMVVTGTDPQGFFVTDLTSCRLKEGTDVRVPEPGGFLPGTYGSMFIYNYAYPEGLDQGDLLFTIAGAVQEFSGTTQFTFPSWTIAEKVRQLPLDQWNKWLDQVKPVELNHRLCGLDDTPRPFVTDVLCGHNRANLKMESLESALVKVRNVGVPQRFVACDADGNNEVPFFCETVRALEPAVECMSSAQCPTGTTCRAGFCSEWYWSGCDFSGNPEPENVVAERDCNLKCLTGQGELAPTLCSERATFSTFGQFVVEMAPPGAAEAGFDTSLPKRAQQVDVSGPTPRTTEPYVAGAEVSVYCTGRVRVKFGDETVVATAADAELEPYTVLWHTFAAGESHVAFFSTAPLASCTVAQNPRTRINVVTRDALPDLQPDCNPDDADADRAQQCRDFRGARYDIVGHLRHLQAARPRWVILPRDTDDICCYPGPGLACPRPIKACP
jgi:hypothetical protein